MKKYEKPQIDVCQIAAVDTILLNSSPLPVNNEEGSGIQRAKQFSDFEDDEEEEF